MAARKNPKPLKVLVHHSLWHCKEIQELVDKGHEVTKDEGDEYDLYLSPKAWRMNESLTALVKVAVTAVRAVKFKRAKKGKDDDEE